MVIGEVFVQLALCIIDYILQAGGIHLFGHLGEGFVGIDSTGYKLAVVVLIDGVERGANVLVSVPS